MRSALKGAVARSAATSSRGLTNYGPARAQVQAQLQQTQDSLSSHGDLINNHGPRGSGSDPIISIGSNRELSRTYFDASGMRWGGLGSDNPQDPNKANLGKTLRILQDRLPTLLQSPLPQHILAPNIALHLFPSTHPHLPTVSGRVAYTAALWSSPIAWNRVPIIGNVKIEILAERMTSEPLTFLPRRAGAIPEQLVVRWCEKRKTSRGTNVGNAGDKDGEGGIARALGLGSGVEGSKAFTGLFIFDFDKEGRILTHTIETAQQSGNWEKGMGAKFVGLTDWLLGGMKDPGDTVPAFARLSRKRRME